MKLRPTGYYILIKMEEVEQEVQEGALKGFTIATSEENKREQSGHDVGIVESIGPTVFSGLRGIPDKDPTGRQLDERYRAHKWGVKIGDKVEFNRYDGKQPRHEEYQNHRIIQDEHIIGVLED